MEDLKERQFKLRHRLISFLRDIDLPGFRKLSVTLPTVLLPAYSKVGCFILQTPMGIKLIIDPSCDNGVERSLYETGYYEKGVINYIRKNMKGDGCFIDVGANIGLMSLFVAKEFPGATIHAFEAHPDTYAILEKNLKLNNAYSVNAHQLALGDSEGKVMIYPDMENNRGGASIKFHTDQKGVSVEMKRLDDLLAGEKVSMIKIDVEGFEAEVLDGARELIEKDRPVLIVEISQERDMHKETERILAFLDEFGYSLFKLQGSKERRSKLIPVKSKEELPKHDNIICIAVT